MLISFTLNRLRVCWLITNLLFIGTPRQPLFYHKFIFYLSQIALKKKLIFFFIKYCCTPNIYYVKFRMINSFICVFIIYIYIFEKYFVHDFQSSMLQLIFNLLCWFCFDIALQVIFKNLILHLISKHHSDLAVLYYL